MRVLGQATIGARLDDGRRTEKVHFSSLFFLLLLSIVDGVICSRLRAKSVRQMLTWGHYQFRQFLKNRSKRTNCIVRFVTEEYTSKTCGQCGNIHGRLGGAKRFRCPDPQCGFNLDRDANAARNILLKNAESIDFSVTERHPRRGVALPSGAVATEHVSSNASIALNTRRFASHVVHIFYFLFSSPPPPFFAVWKT